MGCNGEDRASDTAWLARALPVICCLLATAALGQPMPSEDRIPDSLNLQQVTVYPTAPGTGVLAFTVFAEKSAAPLDRQALLKLVNLTDQTATWQTTGA